MSSSIRNFCIIAHVDHGKSTLADRFLELTGTVEKRKFREQYLDSMPLEREKGITIKMQPVRMEYKGNVLNLIDTPGHVDFTYEVSRSLAAVEGVILLVDAVKGIQAQTLANLQLAQQQGLTIIPCVNKIDLPSANTEEVVKATSSLLGVPTDSVFRISAKTGKGVAELLDEVVKRVPAPSGNDASSLQALIFDSRYDTFKGVVAYVRVMQGSMSPHDNVWFAQSGAPSSLKETGYFLPNEKPSSGLKAGDIGYAATGLKSSESVRIGDTVVGSQGALGLPGYKEPQPLVFVSLYPENPDEFDILKDAIGKLKLNDPSFTADPESREALGRGFRCGFLGVLHSEIIAERIRREYNLGLVVSRPSVEFLVLDKQGREIAVRTAGEWPDPGVIEETKEPWARLRVLAPSSQYAQVLSTAESIEGMRKDISYIGASTVLFEYEVPLRELIIDFYDRLKSATQGLASMDYEVVGFRPGDLVKLDILVAGEREEALAFIVPRAKAESEGRKIVEKLKEKLPRQLFAVPLQAAISGKVLARETMSANRRDVIAPLYGGDVTRKRKLLERQKKGKKELAQKGRVKIPAKVFLELFRS